MQEIPILPQYNLILVRYDEMWLKSTRVKIRMLHVLMKNMKNMLNRAQIPFTKYQLSKDSSRIFFFFKNEFLDEAIQLFKKIFGIYSFSPTLRTSNNIKNISEKSIEIAEQVIKNNDTFALRVKRSGNHDYTSKDIAIKIGQDIIDHFSRSNISLKVNLTNPDKIIFIEVRDEFSYIFTDVIKTDWGGLPIESNKKIAVMDVGRLNDLLAGFLLMRRGAEIYPFLFDVSDDEKIFSQWLANWKLITGFIPSFKFTLTRIKLSEVLHEMMNLIEEKHFCASCRILRMKILSNLFSGKNNEGLKGIKAITDGMTFTKSTPCKDEVDLKTLSLNYLWSGSPIFTPNIGFDLKNLEETCFKISPDLTHIDFCSFKPRAQESSLEELVKILNSPTLDKIVTTCISKVEKINIM